MCKMNIEDVKVVEVEYVTDTCSKRKGQFSWEEMMSCSKTMGENTVIIRIKVNNGYEKKRVTFKFLNITKKLTYKDGRQHEYFSVEIEDVDGEFGKLTCTTSEVRVTEYAVKTLKNKLTNEYRKTLKIRENATKNLKEENKQLKKDYNEQKAIANKRSIENSVLKGTIATMEVDHENALMVLTDEYKNEVATLNKEINRLNQAFLNIKTQEIVYNDDSLEQFLQMAETLANSKVNHETFKHIMKKQLEELFLK